MAVFLTITLIEMIQQHQTGLQLDVRRAYHSAVRPRDRHIGLGGGYLLLQMITTSCCPPASIRCWR